MQQKQKYIGVRLNDKIWQMLAAYAERKKMTTSRAVRQLIIDEHKRSGNDT